MTNKLKNLKQHGLASVELVMIAPIILVFILLIANISQFWHFKIKNQIEARTDAYIESYYNLINDDGCKDSERLAERLRKNSLLVDLAANTDNTGLDAAAGEDTLNGVLDGKSYALALAQSASGIEEDITELIYGNACRGKSDFGGILNSMTKAKGDSSSHPKNFVANLGLSAVQPYATTGRAYHVWGQWGFPWAKKGYLLEDFHALDINGTFQQKEYPLAYDDYLKRVVINMRDDSGFSRSAAESAEATRRAEQHERETKKFEKCFDDDFNESQAKADSRVKYPGSDQEKEREEFVKQRAVDVCGTPPAPPANY